MKGKKKTLQDFKTGMLGMWWGHENMKKMGRTLEKYMISSNLGRKKIKELENNSKKRRDWE